MALADVKLPLDFDPLPADVGAFLEVAERRIEAFQLQAKVPGFVASDYRSVYRVLRALACANLPGRLFCEWGSGFGVVACLAAKLGFQAVGIEIEPELVEAARKLARDFAIPAEFIVGSFIPLGANIQVDRSSGYLWLRTEETANAAFDIGDFDVIFVYPWPNEGGATEKVFEQYARAGALLVTYHGGNDVRLRRKVGKGRR
jgi:predicted O-methyltransferase YrrM